MDIQKIKELALANGFKLKEQASGNMDLNAYVYDFANAIEQAAKAQAVPEGFVLVKTFDIAKLAIAVSRVDLMTYSEARPDSEKLAWQDVANKLEAMIEAQEPAND
ncbi:hypothetical protein [Acinetobacter sp. CS-2]|uniref:hypothetical protein n=1 Tax=Acinetobacter sp. CS-2 TaxID=2798861 RepID=UPI0019057CE3|nr:hypothetical protein [Acinetobacter sp. CS-2]QQN40382.1 hypothetical protein JFY49_05595 [Acinetobacter sp. CS-2]